MDEGAGAESRTRRDTGGGLVSDCCVTSSQLRKNCITARAAERPGHRAVACRDTMRATWKTNGVQLFDRSTRLTRLTWAGQVFLGECRRVITTVEQAVKGAKVAA